MYIVPALILTTPPFSLQEIYPPKIFDFAYVTDGACDVDDIQQTELLMLKVRGRASCLAGNSMGRS